VLATTVYRQRLAWRPFPSCCDAVYGATEGFVVGCRRPAESVAGHQLRPYCTQSRKQVRLGSIVMCSVDGIIMQAESCVSVRLYVLTGNRLLYDYLSLDTVYLLSYIMLFCPNAAMTMSGRTMTLDPP
jgi:hypothetical protein